MEGAASIKMEEKDLNKLSGMMTAIKGLAEKKCNKFLAGCEDIMEKDKYDLRKESDSQADAFEEGLTILEGKLRTEGKKKLLAELLLSYDEITERRAKTATAAKEA